MPTMFLHMIASPPSTGWDKPIPELDVNDALAMSGLGLCDCSFFPHYTSDWAGLVGEKAGVLDTPCVCLVEQDTDGAAAVMVESTSGVETAAWWSPPPSPDASAPSVDRRALLAALVASVLTSVPDTTPAALVGGDGIDDIGGVAARLAAELAGGEVRWQGAVPRFSTSKPAVLSPLRRAHPRTLTFTYPLNHPPCAPTQSPNSEGTLAASRSGAPEPSNPPIAYPSWMEGEWNTQYSFKRALFPQTRGALSLRVPGAGLATCMVSIADAMLSEVEG